VRNRAIDSFRKERATSSRNVGDEGLAERMPAPERTEAEIERRDDARQVRAALITVPEEQRRVIELAYFGGFSHTQIAELLGLPAGTVKGRMRLGLAKMRLALADPADVLL
jgi:RNA polymerase sigma-70 factor (ECF subfamily)